MTTSVDTGRSPTLGRSPDLRLEDESPTQLAQAELPPEVRPIEERLAGGAVETPTAESRALARTTRRVDEQAMRAFMLGDGAFDPNVVPAAGPEQLIQAQGQPGVPPANAVELDEGQMLQGLGHPGFPPANAVEMDEAPWPLGEAAPDPQKGGGLLGQQPAPAGPAPRLNPHELEVALRHPLQMLAVADTPQLAHDAAARTGLDGLGGGDADAFRHAYWNAIMTRRAGAEFADAFATAHETGSDTPEADQAMDLHNNAVGRRIAVANPDASDDELFDLVMQAYRNGELMLSPPE
ncbi:MAG: hypothetical protein RMA76_40795 [Deltaproteobacteria bacterium]|jgi:hypothetical protein